MKLEIKINNQSKNIKLLERNGNLLKIQVNDKIYEIDASHTSTYVWSVLHNNKSYNIEIAPVSENGKKYAVTLGNEMINAEVIDAQTRYAEARKKASGVDEGNVISTPMPGKVVKIPVNEGDIVDEGTTVIIVEAMKMQSEYKVNAKKKVKKIVVKVGDAIDGNQPLILLEDAE